MYRYIRTFSKKSGRWTAFQRKVKKTYNHVNDIFKVLKMRLELEECMYRPAEISAKDPRRLSRTIAPKSSPPTAEIS